MQAAARSISFSRQGYNLRLRTLSEARVEAVVLLVCQRFSGVAHAVQVWCGQGWVEVAGRSDVGRTS